MALTPLAYVYATEADIQSLMSIAGEQARGDDYVGQLTVSTTSAGAIAAGTTTVTPVSMAGILAGTFLQVADGVNHEFVTVTAITGSTFTATFLFPYVSGVVITVAGNPNPYIQMAINWATSKVNFYALSLYAAADLATSYLVNQWTVVLCAQWLSTRRGNPAPGSFKDLYDETIEDLKLIKTGEYQIPDIGYRDVAWPAWSNVRVDILRTFTRVRVERGISERTSTPYVQHRDLYSDFYWNEP